MSETCRPHHDWFTATLTAGLCVGLFVSYAPQHFRIINKKSSEGFSPWFLLLGSTSSAAGMLNMFTMQWGIMKCCRVVSFGSCIEMTAGVLQLFLQWTLFTVILVLYIMYYPPHLKYAEVDLNVNTHDTRLPQRIKTPIKSDEWRLSIILTWVVVIHLLLISFTTFFLLLTATPSPSPASPLPHQISAWATFLGVSSAILAAIQYAPQIIHTYRMKLVGALSIPMMVIQSPGAGLMVISIALRPGTNWTSWIMFAVSGVMQAALLVMCIAWKFRQRRLDIDDFGHPLHLQSEPTPSHIYEDDVPGLVVGEEDPAAVRVALAAALESAVEADVRSGGVEEVEEVLVGEETPLLGSVKDVKTGDGRSRVGWFGWFGKKG